MKQIKRRRMNSVIDKYESQVENLFKLALVAKERISYLKGLTFNNEPENTQLRAVELERMIKEETISLSKNIEKINEELHKLD